MVTRAGFSVVAGNAWQKARGMKSALPCTRSHLSMTHLIRVISSAQLWLVFGVLGPVACGASPASTAHGDAGGQAGSGGTGSCSSTPLPDLMLNEISSNNDGNAVDELGDADDWVEIVNRGAAPASLDELTLAAAGNRAKLPTGTIAPGSRIILWADNESIEGPTHLPFKLPASGTRLILSRCNQIADQVDVPALDTNVVFARFPDATGAFGLCRYATPNHPNGDSCVPPAPPPLADNYHFSQYAWSLPHPSVPSPLTIDELALHPAQFVELRNTSANAIDLAAYQLRLAPVRPGQPWPGAADGVALSITSAASLGPNERQVVPVTTSDIAAIASDPHFEGVATLFSADGAVADRVDFVRWPEGAALARVGQYSQHHVFCAQVTPGAPNDSCEVLTQRDVGDYVRHLRTSSDFDALAAGGGETGMASVKFIVDMAAGNQIYLVGWRDWSLHYEFIREVIEGQPALNRCNVSESNLFNRGWYDFSVTEYFQATGRRYLLGTLVHHAQSDLFSVEFAVGDEILPEDMQKAFLLVTGHVLNPEAFFLRPQDASQTSRALSLDGELPIVGPNAPFAETQLQPLTTGVGYGVLTYVPAQQLESASLGLDVIVVTDDVPNDIPLVGGLVTEAFQTPLSHVNVLCQNRGTPNLALPNAHNLSEWSSFVGQLVRFEVTADGYHLEAASPEAAQAFWDSKKPSATNIAPRLDAQRTGFVDLQQATLSDLPSIGAKAAQLAELVQLSKSYSPNCPNAKPFVVPEPAFALPMSYFLAHLESSGAQADLKALLADPEASANRNLRHERLLRIRNDILQAPVDTLLLRTLVDFLRTNYGNARVRMRSSSNAEDLPGFNGAGLYSSASAAVNDPDYPVADALRQVWASFYSNRGYDERLLMNVDQLKVAMGVLIHPAFPEERANGVVISRNIDDITRGDIYTFNVQRGEAAVTNPAPGVTSDQFTYQWPPRTPAIATKSFSSFNGAQPVLSPEEVVSTACAMRAIVNHFRPLLDPNQTDSYFTMDMEFKLLTDEHALLIKQARPYSFGSWHDPGDCREF